MDLNKPQCRINWCLDSETPRLLQQWGKFYWTLLICLVLGLFQGCASLSWKDASCPKPSMQKLLPADFPCFSDDLGYDALAYGIAQNLAYLEKLSCQKLFSLGDRQYTRDQLMASHERFLSFILQNPSQGRLNQFIREHYDLYQSAGKDQEGQVLFTGYYEPMLRGSLRASSTYSHPIYERPDDLMTIDLSAFSPRFGHDKIIGRIDGRRFVPYFDRKAIDYENKLDGVATPLVWVDDPIDLFFLHIQGSGRVYLDSGACMPVHYHAANGHPYRSIGKWLIEKEKIPRAQMSMQAIRKYLVEHPQEVEAILSTNPSYVFFKRELVGPLGCLGVPLTPGRSLALDRRVFPLATLGFIQTKKPVIDGQGNIDRWINCSRFVVNQDTGGAIRGPGRADLFWGDGSYARIAAGHMQHHGKLYFLVLKQKTP